MSNAASKKTLIIMVAVFVLPVVLAKLALDNEWFTKGATNKGQLLAPTIDMSALLENAEPKWRLLYVMPSKCDAVCENALFSIQNALKTSIWTKQIPKRVVKWRKLFVQCIHEPEATPS